MISSTLLATGEKVACEQTDRGIRATVPIAKRQWIDTVIVLKLDGSAEELPIIETPLAEPK